MLERKFTSFTIISLLKNISKFLDFPYTELSYSNVVSDYTINFVIWWYVYKVPQLGRTVLFKYMYMLNATRALPMLKNFYKPLYGDTSAFGIFIGFFVRTIWGIFGLIISTVYIFPFIIFLIVLAILPAIPIIQVFNLLIGQN